MADVKYTPQQLLAQSTEMTALQTEYAALFSKVANALNGINESWSENLARNFSGKIQSAQKSFGSITNMLANGAAAAKLGATSHSPTSIESFLSQTSGGGGGHRFTTGGTVKGLIDDMVNPKLIMSSKEKKEALERIDKYLAGRYDDLPPEVKEALNKYTPSLVKNVVSVSHDVISGEMDGATVETVLGEIFTEDTIIGKVGGDIFDEVMEARREGVYANGDALMDKGDAAIDAGDTLEGIGYYLRGTASYLTSSTKKIGEDIGDTISDMIDWAKGKDMSKVGSALHQFT